MSKIAQDAEGAVYNQQVSFLQNHVALTSPVVTLLPPHISQKLFVLVLQRPQIYHWYHQGLV